jgi:hypothetical protein
MNCAINLCRALRDHQKKTSIAGGKTSSSQRICSDANLIKRLPIASEERGFADEHGAKKQSCSPLVRKS